jgi:hypothetical protein
MFLTKSIDDERKSDPTEAKTHFSFYHQHGEEAAIIGSAAGIENTDEYVYHHSFPPDH